MRTLLVALATIPLFACPEPKAQYCAQLESEAQSAVVPTAAEVSCKADSDCVLVSTSEAECGDVCDVAVSEAGATLAQVNANTCATFFNSGCEPVPSMCIPREMEPLASCIAGRCEPTAVPPTSEDAGVDGADGSFDAASE
jgi:hypothetical protein